MTMHSLMISSESLRDRRRCFLHLRDDQLLIERAGVDADADGLAVVYATCRSSGSVVAAPAVRRCRIDAYLSSAGAQSGTRVRGGDRCSESRR